MCQTVLFFSFIAAFKPTYVVIAFICTISGFFFLLFFYTDNNMEYSKNFFIVLYINTFIPE